MSPPSPAQVPLVTLLEWLFSGHPARMIKMTKTEDGQKQVVTYPRGARSGDYAKHLAVGATAGTGAIGLFPGYPEKGRGEEGSSLKTKSRWLVNWAALDFDGVPLESLHGLIQALWDDGLPCYPTKGTTGRGAHLFFFFMQPVDQPKVVRGLQVLAERIEKLKLPKPELRPSSPYSPGNGILLPYRGGDRDGLGANPILDPMTFVAIPLSEFNPVHIEAEEWLELLRVNVESQRSKVEGQKHKAKSQESFPQLESNTALERWNSELQRLTPFWQKGKRQDLILGLSAFGCYLGLPIGKISTDLQAFLNHQGDKDLSERLRGVERTLKKFAEGQRVSYRYWYAKAQVPAPANPKTREAQLEPSLLQLRQQLNQICWIGEGGLTDYAVYKTLVETAEQFGELEPSSTLSQLSITLSRRDLLIKSGLASLKTLYKSLQRLSERGLVVSGVPSRGTQSGGFFLPLKLCNTNSIPPCFSLSMSSEQKSVTPVSEHKTVAPRYPRAAFRRGKGLGKLAERVLDGLLELGNTATITQIAARLKRPYDQIEKSLTSLNFYQVIDFTSTQDTVTLAPKWEEALLDAAKRTGALEAIARLKARFAKERAERRKAFWRKVSRQGAILQEPLVLEVGEGVSSSEPLGP